ncbi:MAG: hypothetical protein DMG39_04355 [Acidobacteria bacterium]|nr:MAG: hypothetical protein DMG39_04355 [Acidobacteriota bacterium]
MPYEFAKNEFELEAASSSARSGGPPRKATGTGILDPPVPPKRPHGPIAAAPTSLFFRVLGGLLLLGHAAGFCSCFSPGAESGRAIIATVKRGFITSSK